MAAMFFISSAHVVLLVAIQTASCHFFYQSEIPNGQTVMDPCDSQSTWKGVGHQMKEGGRDRNPFGIDFFNQGKKWTRKLCKMDSDKDGRSNGEELGDPHCEWTKGAVPNAPATSHPGICEPLNSTRCKDKNDWLTCEKVSNLEHGLCKHLEPNTTFSKDLKLSPTLVPPVQTSYYCQLFDLDVTGDHHMVATKPLVDTIGVVHHILLFGCDSTKESVKSGVHLRSPYPCDMVPDEGCRPLIGAWTINSHGECTHPEMGFRIGGKYGYRTVALQVHWNNVQRTSNLTDSSGLRIFLTTSLRRHDAGMLVIGQSYMQIDPVFTAGSDQAYSNDGNSDMEFSATCPERCTKVMFNEPIYITSAVNHMHYLGKSQLIKVYRNNTEIREVTNQKSYNYNDPVIYTFNDAIKVNPGDELRTTCVYKRTTTPNPVCWGEATTDEMCFGFITYYPVQPLSHPWCTSTKSFPSCVRHLPSLRYQPVNGCKWWEFRDANNSKTKELMGQVYARCYPNNGDVLSCNDKCRALAQKVASHPCMQGDVGTYMLDKFKSIDNYQAFQILDAIITCSCQRFQYCERKSKNGTLGSRQSEFCSFAIKLELHSFSVAILLCIVWLAL